MSLNVDDVSSNPNEGAQKVKDRNIGSVMSRRRRYLQEQKQGPQDASDAVSMKSEDEELKNAETRTFSMAATKKGWEEEEQSAPSKAKNGRGFLGMFGKTATEKVPE